MSVMASRLPDALADQFIRLEHQIKNDLVDELRRVGDEHLRRRVVTGIDHLVALAAQRARLKGERGMLLNVAAREERQGV
jgi:hypothetical protein